MERAALISVSDRSGLVPLAHVLIRCGYRVLSTSGTATFLEENGIKVTRVENYTGQKEILDGRVKTLHPKIHAGLLAKRDNQAHMRELESAEIYPIDIAIVNLYPFSKQLAESGGADPSKMIEFIDIGGPTMIRAAAKNFKAVLPVIDPADYPAVMRYLEGSHDEVDKELELRHRLAAKVFVTLAQYNLEIARYLSTLTISGNGLRAPEEEEKFPLYTGEILVRQQALRYGENPHQRGALYRSQAAVGGRFKQFGGKELSYNNLLDVDAIVAMLRALQHSQPSVVIVKHLNPCGAASGTDLRLALLQAKECDPVSHFGGIIGFNGEVTLEVAEEVRKDFCEIVVAPSFSSSARELFAESKNLRVVEVDLSVASLSSLRSVEGGFLAQEIDRGPTRAVEAEIVSERKPSETEIADLEFAWTLCSHVKSNAITIVKNQRLVGVGAGQMSRIDSTLLAIGKARQHGHDLSGAVAASDAFFPFTDGIEELAKAGIVAVIAPSGSKRDGEVKDRANEVGVSLLFAPDRHFRH